MNTILILLFIIIIFLLGNMCVSEHLEQKAPWRFYVPYIPYNNDKNLGPWNKSTEPRFSKQEVYLWNKNLNNTV